MHSPPSPDQQDDLISSLSRHDGSTATWKIRTNQLARDDIRRQRRAAIASGNLKARRLSYHHIHTDLSPKYHNIFPPNYVSANASLPDHLVVPSIQSSDSAAELGKEVPVCLNGLSYSPSASSSSAASSSSSSSLLCKQIMKEQMVAIAKEEQNVTPTPMPTPTPTVGEKLREIGISRKIAKWEVPLACLAIASSVIMVIFISVRCLGFGAFDDEPLPFLLLPT